MVYMVQSLLPIRDRWDEKGLDQIRVKGKAGHGQQDSRADWIWVKID